ncbi:MAG: isochorismatase family protein [Candidatus Berkiellales bacterium]
MISIAPKKFVASFDVDAQYSFTPSCPDELPVPEGEEIVAELNHQAKFAQYRLGSKEGHSAKAIWVTQKNIPAQTPLQGENVDCYWPLHCVPGTKGFELIQGLPHPSHYDFFVWKGIEPDMHPYGSCFHDFKEKLSTGVIEFLRQKGVTTIIVGGLTTEFCVRKTALQLLQAGFKTIINLAACRGVNEEPTKKALEEMRNQGAIIIASSHLLEQEQ